MGRSSIFCSVNPSFQNQFFGSSFRDIALNHETTIIYRFILSILNNNRAINESSKTKQNKRKTAKSIY